VVPPPLGASIQAIVSPVKNEGIPEGLTASVNSQATKDAIIKAIKNSGMFRAKNR
jgi:hypothetical protein